MGESKLNDMIRTSLENIRDLVDVNTVIGDPIHTENGVTIIPVSKVSVGFASGGLDYLGKQPAAQKGVKNFGGGGGTGITVTPVAFIVIKSGGDVELLNVDISAKYAGGNNSIVNGIMDVFEKSPDFVVRMKDALVKKKDDKKEAKKTESESENE